MGPRYPRVVDGWPWTSERADQWCRRGTVSRAGLCAWNHTRKDGVSATTLVVLEDGIGDQSAWACCEACHAAIATYVAGSGGAPGTLRPDNLDMPEIQ
jgi:hypothetical protein